MSFLLSDLTKGRRAISRESDLALANCLAVGKRYLTKGPDVSDGCVTATLLKVWRWGLQPKDMSCQTTGATRRWGVSGGEALGSKDGDSLVGCCKATLGSCLEIHTFVFIVCLASSSKMSGLRRRLLCVLVFIVCLASD